MDLDGGIPESMDLDQVALVLPLETVDPMKLVYPVSTSIQKLESM